MNNKAVIFIAGQSNAHAHAQKLPEEDWIRTPLGNVFSLDREPNQAYDRDCVVWSGFTTAGKNLGETQDHTWSVANCLAKQWQAEIDGGNPRNLPDLYIVQIAIGAQGVSENYMWYPEREKKLIPGPLGTADISLFPFTMEILSLLDDSFRSMDMEYEILGLHWRGGEEETCCEAEDLEGLLTGIYRRILPAFSRVLNDPPILLHWIIAADRVMDLDPTGVKLQRMHTINRVFARMAEEMENVSIFDPRNAPQYTPDVRGTGVFIEDMVHFTPEVNRWVASEILNGYR